MFKNMKIGMKILIAALGMSLGAMMVVFIDAYVSMDRLSGEIQKTNTSLGLTASDDSKEALQSQAEEYLTRIIQKQALYSNKQLSEISRTVTVAAEYTKYLYEDSSQFLGAGLPQQTPEGEAGAQYMLAPGTDATEDIMAEVRLLSNCEAIFAPSLSENKMLDSFYVGTRSGIWYRYSKSNHYDPSYDPRAREWYKNAAGHQGNTVWLDTYTDFYGNVCITCARAFCDAQGNLIGVVAADIQLKDMLNEITRVKIGQSGHAFVIDRNKTLIAHPDYFEEGFEKDIECHVQIQEEYRGEVNASGGKGSGIISLTLDGIDSYLAFHILDETEWYLCVSVDKEEVIRPALDTKQEIDSMTGKAQEHIQEIMSSVMKRFILFFAVIGGVMVIVSFAVAGSITRPIQKLAENVALIGRGELDRKVDVECSDEIGSLAEAFNRMLEDLNDYIRRITLITAEKERIGAELQVATQIQADMLPGIFPPFLDREDFDIYATMAPAKEVGGDFYDFFMVDDTHLAMVMADVSGKGVPAALFMVIGKTLIKDHTKAGIPLGEVFTEVNRLLCESNKEGLFITAFECVLDLKTGSMVYVNAGHEPPFIAKYNETYKMYNVTPQFVLAGYDDMTYQHGELQLAPGDRLFLFTDGITDAVNADGQLYGMERLSGTLCANAAKKPRELLQAVRQDIDRFVGGEEQFDDITMLGLEFKKKIDGLNVKAELELLDAISDFADSFMEGCGYSGQFKRQVGIVIEEVYTNICSYAYPDKPGGVKIDMAAGGGQMELTFTDSGAAYNPLEKKDPDITAQLEERKIGGLGIFMVKQIMDDVSYYRSDGRNVLRMVKTTASGKGGTENENGTVKIQPV